MSYDEYWHYEPELLNAHVLSFQRRRKEEQKQQAQVLDLLAYAHGIYTMHAIGSAFSGKVSIKEPLRFFREQATKEQLQERVTREIKEGFEKSELINLAREENIPIKGDAR